MSRRIVLFVSAGIMLALALVVARVFREPVEVVASMESRDDLTLDPSRPSLPPVEAMAMTTGDYGPQSGLLPVTPITPTEDAPPVGVGRLIADSPANAGMVTEPPTAVNSPAEPITGPAAQPMVTNQPPAKISEPTALAASKETPVLETVPSAQGQSVETPVPDAVAPSDAAAPGVAAPEITAPAVTATPSEANASAAAVSPSEASSTRSVSAERPVRPGTMVSKSSLPAKSGENVATSMTLTMDGDVVTLRIEGTAPMRGKAFLLTNPDRVVLDVEGAWKMETPKVTSNRMVQALRVGAQNTATRLVFDMRVKPAKVTVTQADDKTLELRIR